MFENLTEKLERSFKIIKGQGRITEINIAETLKEVRRALLDADVSYRVAKDFCNDVKAKALGQNVLTAVRPDQMMIKIVHDELVTLMGSTASDINIKGKPGIVLVSGLQGSGKTTFCGKLALNCKSKRGLKVMLVAGDVYRPAAIDQLKVLGGQIEVFVYSEDGVKDPVKIAKNAIAYATKENYSLVIVDTAGRLAVDEEMMDEIAAIKEAVKPTETLFVVDAMTGQDAVETAKAFNDRLDFDGVVLTKMDGDTRGGAALSVKAVVNKPIKFISSGEKMEALDVFHPDRIADRILGMGDVVSLVEKAQEQYDEQEARKLAKKLAKNQFNLWDFYQQIQQIKKMGNIKDLASMIPGVGKALKDVDIDNNSFKSVEAIILSMTPYERENPAVINSRCQPPPQAVRGHPQDHEERGFGRGPQCGKDRQGHEAQIEIFQDNIKQHPMILLNGKETAAAVKKEIAAKVAEMVSRGERPPHLVAVLVGDNGASKTYVAEVGFKSTVLTFPETISEAELLAQIHKLNEDDDVDGFIVQLPVPKHIDENKVINAVSPMKDVDGFHPVNAGRMALGEEAFLPATPFGILLLLEHYGIETSGKHCVILGRSNIVGRPVANLLSRKAYPGDCTVTMCHSRTKDIAFYTRSADIIVAALGVPEFLKGDMVKEGAVVIDVGITRVPADTPKGYRIVGDVEFDTVAPKCSYITPVPGGVGPMTIISLMKNTFRARELKLLNTK